MPVGLGKSRLMRTEWFPQPHQEQKAWAYELDDATIDSTIMPIIMYDEGLGTPSAQETHPENAAFAVATRPNVFVNSRINNINARVTYSLTSKALDENIPAIRVSLMVIKMAFAENYTAVDELSGDTVASILEMQTEATDRQGFPLYVGSAAKMAVKFTGSSTLNAAVPGLTTTQLIEGVAFDPTAYYDAIHFETIAGIIKNSQRGLMHFVLTPNRPVVNIDIKIDSKVKRANEFTFLGVLCHVNVVDSVQQLPATGDITAATKYVYCDVWTRYNEWNADFDFKII